MMNIALLDAGKTQSVLKRLIKDYDDIHIAVAWGYNGNLADLLMENSNKFRSAIFGLNGFVTSPDLVERLIGTKNAFIAKADNGIFHPKLYLFLAGEKAEAIVGSANFTEGGLDRNHEACVHIEGPADGDLFKQIQRELSGYDVLKQRVTQTLADSYRRQYDAARRHRGQRDPILPDEKNGGKGLASPLAMMSWKDFTVTIGDATGAANSAPTTSGTTSLPFRASVRQDDRWFAFNPCRRATSFTVTPGTSVSATIRPFASSDHRRLAAGAASSSTNPTASILRSRWTPTDASRANLHTGPHRSLRIQQEGGVKTALTANPLSNRD